jgi:hypothetical protein
MKTANYEIRWFYRDCEVKGKPTKETICRLKSESKDEFGVALCSLKDNFSRDKGRKLSLLRAIQRIGVPKKERKPIWDAYRDMSPTGRW